MRRDPRLWIGLALLLGHAACRGESSGARTASAPLPPPPPALGRGESLFVAHCARCHGAEAGGTGEGPPLAHPIYRPAHHGDAAFLLAVRRGVVAHHWRFGDMPPLPRVTDPELEAITGYVRWVQRARGIR